MNNPIESVRAEIRRLLRAAPFRPFVLTLESGERVLISYPENIAFDPGTAEGVGGSEEFYVISSGLRWFSTFQAVSSISLLDQGQLS